MRTIIRDREALASIGLHDLIAYLRANGWIEQSTAILNATSWQRPDAPEEEVLLPKSDQVLDYADRVSDAVAAIEQVEQRPQLAIVRDLAFSSADIVRFRHPVGSAEAESIAIADGVALVKNAYDLMASAAATAVAPRKVLPPRRPHQAIDYMKTLRLGHTERGSFVVTVVSRVAPLLTRGEPGLLEMMGEPFPRAVILTLDKALRAAKHAASDASSSGRFDAFERAVELGVSANLCDSLVGMARSDQGTQALAIHVAWAPSRPHQASEPIVFRPDAVEILQEAARVFRDESAMEDAVVIGAVTKVQREPDSSVRSATVACILDEKPRNVLMQLSESDFHLATAAIDKGIGVAFNADIVRDGRMFRAQSVRGLRLLEADEQGVG
jgi:hypothetical protein